MRLRSYHWVLAFALALALHLGSYLALFLDPVGVTPSYRGGGAQEQGGDDPDAGGGVYVSLGQLGDHPGAAPAEVTPRRRKSRFFWGRSGSGASSAGV